MRCVWLIMINFVKSLNIKLKYDKIEEHVGGYGFCYIDATLCQSDKQG